MEAESIADFLRADNILWVADLMGRVGGGTTTALLHHLISGYAIFLGLAVAYLIGTIGVFIIVVFDVNSAFWLVLTAVYYGFTVGMCWVMIV